MVTETLRVHVDPTSQSRLWARELSSAAYRDSLTGLYRKWHLIEQIRLEVARATRHRRPVSVLLFELKGGAEDARHPDYVRRAFATRLQSTCRTSDILAHVAKDEFCALLQPTVSFR